MRALVISTKGGCGKSTFCFEVLAPYLGERSKKKPTIYEFDNENKESLNYAKSDIFVTQNMPFESMGAISNKLNEISQTDNYIVDVGGSAHSSNFLKANANFIKLWFDFVFIPLGQGAQDAVNAKSVFEQIKSGGFDASKIAFVCSSAMFTYDEENIDMFLAFFGSPYFPRSKGGYGFDGRIPKDSKPDNYLFVKFCPFLPWSKLQQRTAYEVGKDWGEYLKKLDDPNMTREEKLAAQYNIRTLGPIMEWAEHDIRGQAFIALDRITMGGGNGN